jgi:membrane protein implicated in regulation of membrane protease activity
VKNSLIFSVVGAIVLYVVFLGWFFVKTYIKHKSYYANNNDFGYISKILGYENGLFHYQVKVLGEIWRSESTEKLLLGDKVIIEGQSKNSLNFIIKRS